MVLCGMRDRTRGRRCQTVLDGFSGQGTVTTQKHEGLMSLTILQVDWDTNRQGHRADANVAHWVL